MTRILLNKWLHAIMISASLLFIISCEPKGKDPKEVAEEQNEPKKDATREKDEKFLVDAAELNMEEISLGQLAQQKGTSADVKNLAKMMTDDHTKALSDLSALAASKSIAIPSANTEKVQNAYQHLNEKAAGNDFDKEYCDMMVKGHKNAIDMFEKAVNECEDTEIKSWASSMLPGLRTHLEHATMCDEKLKKM